MVLYNTKSRMKVVFFPVDFQIQNAAEEPRVLCIIQDTTSAKTVNERLTLNLPASTTLSKLYEDVAHKAGYVNGTFDLAWGNTPDMVRKFINLDSHFCFCQHVIMVFKINLHSITGNNISIIMALSWVMC